MFNFNNVIALYHYGELATDSDNCSAAEFYIQPMLSCVGDFDIMFHHSDQLAIPAGTAPPTHLPDEFDSCVEEWEIVDSQFPGYVYLVSSYLLAKRIDDVKYKAVECERWYLAYKVHAKSHGPAFVRQWFTEYLAHCLSFFKLFQSLPPTGFRTLGWIIWLDYYVSLETVYTACVVCPGRHKLLTGQHDTETTAGQTQLPLIALSAMDVMWFVGHIVSVDEINGCVTDSTGCHSHEQKLYCLNSWIPVQQIVYHLLRVFVKTERLTDSANNSKAAMLSNYCNVCTLLLLCNV